MAQDQGTIATTPIKVGDIVTDFLGWHRGKDKRFEVSRVDTFMRDLHKRRPDPGEHAPHTSAVGRRSEQVYDFQQSLGAEGQRYLGKKIGGALRRDRQFELDREAERAATLGKGPSTFDSATAYLGPWATQTANPLKHIFLGLAPDMPWVEGMEKGVHDAVIQVLMQEEKQSNPDLSDVQALRIARKRVAENDIPSGMKIAHMAAMLPEVGYALPAFGVSGGLLPAVLGAGKIGKAIGTAGGRAAKYAKHLDELEKAGTKLSKGKKGLYESLVKPVKTTPGIDAEDALALGNLG